MNVSIKIQFWMYEWQNSFTEFINLEYLMDEFSAINFEFEDSLILTSQTYRQTKTTVDAGFHLTVYTECDRHAQQTGQTQNCFTRYQTCRQHCWDNTNNITNKLASTKHEYKDNIA